MTIHIYSVFLKNLLSKNGFKVIIHHGGREALEFLLESQNIEINLIIIDDIMPVINGIEFANTLKEMEKYKNIPIILYTQRSNITADTDGYKVFDKTT